MMKVQLHSPVAPVVTYNLELITMVGTWVQYLKGSFFRDMTCVFMDYDSHQNDTGPKARCMSEATSTKIDEGKEG